MGDSYVELMVKRKTNLTAMIFRNIFIGLGAMCVLLMLIAGGLLPVFLLGAALMFILAYFCQQRIYIEYEYLYLDKTFSVDKITNKSKRKKIAEYSLENMEVLAPIGSHHLDSYDNRPGMKGLDFSSRQPDANLYIMIVKNGSTLYKLMIECNDDLYNQIRQIAPRKVFSD